MMGVDLIVIDDEALQRLQVHATNDWMLCSLLAS